MEYSEETLNKLIISYSGALDSTTTRVWKTRNKIPDKYFNPEYIAHLKAGELEKADHVQDKFYNPGLANRTQLTGDEKILQVEIIKILKKPVLNLTQICKRVGISPAQIHEVNRVTGLPVDLSPEHIKALDKEIKGIGNKITSVASMVNIGDVRIREIDKLLASLTEVNTSTLIDNTLYYKRHKARLAGTVQKWDHVELDHLIKQLTQLMLELNY